MSQNKIKIRVILMVRALYGRLIHLQPMTNNIKNYCKNKPKSIFRIKTFKN